MLRKPLLAAFALSLACATSGDSLEAQPIPAVEATPTQTMSELEERLQTASRVEIGFVIESQGAVVSQFEGKLAWARDGALSWTATGMFVGQPQQLELRGDAQTLETFVAGQSHWQGPRPPALIEAVVIGFTRQGLLHNLAMLTGGRPPDHADGGAAEWLAYGEPQLGPPEVFGSGEARPLEFQMIVEGQLAGHATLWLDERNLPVEKRVVVNFPEGQMQVTERYTSFVIVD